MLCASRQRAHAREGLPLIPVPKDAIGKPRALSADSEGAISRCFCVFRAQKNADLNKTTAWCRSTCDSFSTYRHVFWNMPQPTAFQRTVQVLDLDEHTSHLPLDYSRLHCAFRSNRIGSTTERRSAPPPCTLRTNKSTSYLIRFRTTMRYLLTNVVYDGENLLSFSFNCCTSNHARVCVPHPHSTTHALSPPGLHIYRLFP